MREIHLCIDHVTKQASKFVSLMFLLLLLFSYLFGFNTSHITYENFIAFEKSLFVLVFKTNLPYLIIYTIPGISFFKKPIRFASQEC